MKTILKTIALVSVLMGFSGCVSKPLSAVYIPTKCDITMPSPPYPKERQSLSEKYREVLIYTESLEKALNFCITGK